VDRKFDVIVVGARCAGAALARLLATRGARVLMLEAAPRGSDMPMSTHFIHPPGVDVLDALGVGDRVRAAAPASRTLALALDDVRVTTTYPDARAGYCIRRNFLDGWLQDAAESAGATFRDRHRVVDLVTRGERVSGVVVRTPQGTETIGADWVVGADGMHSSVARLAGAEEYLSVEGSRGGYWGYYPAPERWEEEWDGIIAHEGDTLRYVFRCDGDLVLMVAAEPRAVAETWGKEYRARLHQNLLRGKVTGPLARGKQPVGKVMGLLRTQFFYRRPVGAGFALVGDAGHFKDFVTGQGITDALLDAQRLAPALLDGSELALERYWRERDVATLPLHFDALGQGEVGFNSAFMRFVMARMAEQPALAGRAALVADRKLSPFEMLPMTKLLPWMFAALVRGRFDVLKGFVGTGRSQGEGRRELVRRQRLLDALGQQSARPKELRSVPEAAALAQAVGP
jgi:menaquinone-9 beta-reductase